MRADGFIHMIFDLQLKDYTLLTHRTKAPKGLPDPWNLSLPISKQWKKKNGHRKVAVVLESVFSFDLGKDNRRGCLLGSPRSRELVSNVVSLAMRHASRYGWKEQCDFAFLNFNHLPWFSLDKKRQETAKKDAAKRLAFILSRMEPDVVLCLGDNAAAHLTGDPRAREKRGLRLEWKGIPLFVGIDMDVGAKLSKMGSDGDMSVDDMNQINLLGYASRNIMHGLLGRNPHDVSDVRPAPRLVSKRKHLDSMLREVEKADSLALDVETTSLSPFADVLTLQMATREDRAWVLPISHKDSMLPKADIEHARERLASLFGTPAPWDSRKHIVGQNVGFDMRVLSNWLGLRYWHLPVWDLQAGEYLLDENIKALENYGTPQYNLGQMAMNYGCDFYRRGDGFGKDDRTRLSVVPLEGDALDYCAMDVQLLIAIKREQLERAKRLPWGSYRKEYERLMLLHMSSLVRSTAIMMHRGIGIDKNWLLGLSDPSGPLEKEMAEVSRKFAECEEVVEAERRLSKGTRMPARTLDDDASGSMFDMNKREHLGVLFGHVMKLEPLRKSAKTGEPSYDKAFLEHHADSEPVSCMLKLRDLDRVKTGYVLPYLKRMETLGAKEADDGRMRPEYGYVATVTGRLNSKNPNLQNVPNHKESAKLIKRMLVTPPGTLGWEADFSAHEVRCWMHLSGDPNLKAVFDSIHEIMLEHRRKQTEKTARRLAVEGDLHRLNYAMFNNMDVSKVDGKQRQAAKGIVFGTIYGMSDTSLGKRIGASREEAEKLQRKFFARNRKAERWLANVERDAERHCHVSSVLGRRRNLSGFMYPSRQARGALGRRARNSPIQGLAGDFAMMSSDLYARALAESMADLEAAGWNVGNDRLPHGVNNMIHDSIKGESPFDYFFLSLHLVEWSMTLGLEEFVKKHYGFEIPTPFSIEIEVGSNWRQKTKWDWTDKGLDDAVLQALESLDKKRPTGRCIRAIRLCLGWTRRRR